jgi:type I restriction enzyme S subunit
MQLMTLADNFGILLDAPGGISNLREIILTLAVTGELTPQLSGEPPFGLEVNDVKTYPQGECHSARKAFAPCCSSPLFPVPASWRWCSISEVARDFGQKRPDGLFTYIDVSSIDNKLGRLSNDLSTLRPSEAPSRARKIVRKGAVIYSTVRPYLLNIAIIDKDIIPEPIVSTAFSVLDCVNGVFNRYLFWYLRSRPFITHIEGKMKGMAYPAISDSEFKLSPVAVPPLAEQHRIVAKVDHLMQLCDELEQKQDAASKARSRFNAAALEKLVTARDAGEFDECWARVQNNFRDHLIDTQDVVNFSHTVYRLAVRGRLAKQSAGDETAQSLMERIRRSHQTVRVLPEVKESEVEYAVPSSWQWVRFGEIQRFINGYAFKSNEYQKEGIGLVRIGDISGGEIRSSDMTYVSERFLSELKPDLQVRHGDLVIAMSGATTGKVGFNYTRETFLLNQRVGKIVPLLVDSKYLFYFLSTRIRSNLQQSAGTAIPNLSTEQINNTLFPLPPLEEQRRIVTRTEHLLSLLSKIGDQIETTAGMGSRVALAICHRTQRFDNSSSSPLIPLPGHERSPLKASACLGESL